MIFLAQNENGGYAVHIKIGINEKANYLALHRIMDALLCDPISILEKF